MERWIERKIFAPISRIHDFVKYRNGIKELIIPQVNWEKISLKNNREYQSALEGLVRDNKVSTHSLLEALDLNYENEMDKIKKEIDDAKEIAYKLQTPYLGKENINVSTPSAEEMGKAPRQQSGGPGIGGGAPGGMDAGGGAPGGDLGIGLEGGGDAGGGMDLGGLDLGGGGGGEATAPAGGGGAPPAA
jgi:hypothetical protein